MLAKLRAELLTDLFKLYIFLAGPWLDARFFTAWDFYQSDAAYRERLSIFGFRETVKRFLNDKISQRYCLEKQLEKYPELKWRIIFLPWTIERPDIFDIAVNSGITNYS